MVRKFRSHLPSQDQDLRDLFGVYFFLEVFYYLDSQPVIRNHLVIDFGVPEVRLLVNVLQHNGRQLWPTMDGLSEILHNLALKVLLIVLEPVHHTGQFFIFFLIDDIE